MAKFEPRLQDLLVPAAAPVRNPAWFAAQPPVQPAEGALRWDWLDDAQDSTVEVTEFAVTEGFIEALFGVSARASTGLAMVAA